MPDPLAALRSPDGPRLHLLEGAPADARQLAWTLLQQGLVTRIVRGRCMRSVFGLYDEIGAALQLPGEPVEDWDALGDLLAEMSWLPAAGHVLVVVDASHLLTTEATAIGDFAAMVDRIAAHRAGDVDVGAARSFHVLLQDDAAGLAALRSRLGDAAAELTGWSPQEPAAQPSAGPRLSYEPGPRRDALDVAAHGAVAEDEAVAEVRRAVEQWRAHDSTVTRVYGVVLERFDTVGDILSRLADAVAGEGSLIMAISDFEAARSPRQKSFLEASLVVGAQADPPEEVAEVEAAPVPVAEAPAPPSELEPATVVVPDPTIDDSAPPGAKGDFEIVAASLEWEFAKGAAGVDPIDVEVIRYAAAVDGVDGLWRCWSLDPSRSVWIRVVVGAVAAADEVTRFRRGVVELLQPAGAGPSCVEIVATGQLADAHRWLQEQSVRIYPPPAIEPPPIEPTALERTEIERAALVVEPTGDVPVPVREGPESEPGTEPEPGPEAEREPAAELEPATAEELERVSQPESEAEAETEPAAEPVPEPTSVSESEPTSVSEPGTQPEPVPELEPAAEPEVESVADAAPVPEPEPEPEPASVPEPESAAAVDPDRPFVITGDTEFTAAESAEELGPIADRLIAWAQESEGVTGLVAAWTGGEADRLLVFGVVADNLDRVDELRASAAAVVTELEPRHEIVTFSPARKLSPAILRFYRGAKRLWRPQSKILTPDEGGRQKFSRMLNELPKPQERNTDDIAYDNGFTSVGLEDADDVSAAPEEPSDQDAAMVEWAIEHPDVIALAAGVTDDPADRSQVIDVYTVMTAKEDGFDEVRESAAQVLLDRDVARASIQVFNPLVKSVGIFFTTLVVNGRLRWKTDQPVARPTTEDEPAATAESTSEASGSVSTGESGDETST